MISIPDRTLRPLSGRGIVAAALVALACGLVSTTAKGQVPAPRVPDPYQRNGLLTRYTPVLPRLPHDPDRDSFLGTRYQDEHDDSFKLHPRNSCKDGGMYGRPLCAACTAAYYPYFSGSPGGSLGPACRVHHRAVNRWLVNAFHPFKPVGAYYDRGVHVPIYDMDYFVPGPGPFPWPFFLKGHTGG